MKIQLVSDSLFEHLGTEKRLFLIFLKNTKYCQNLLQW